MAAAVGADECFGVYLDTSGSQPICMHLKGCGAGFYLAPLMKSSLHNPSSQQSLWVKLPGTKDDQLQLPFADEYNFHPMSSYALSCKFHIPLKYKILYYSRPQTIAFQRYAERTQDSTVRHISIL